METAIFEYWTVYLNIIACIFCSILMIYFVIKISRRQEKKRQVSFDEEMFMQKVLQETELSFNRIKEAISRERNLLYSYLKNGQVESAKTLMGLRSDETHQNNPTITGQVKRGKVNNPSDQYTEIVRLAEQGNDPRQISEKVKMSKGEVDLVMKIKKCQVCKPQ